MNEEIRQLLSIVPLSANGVLRIGGALCEDLDKALQQHYLSSEGLQVVDAYLDFLDRVETS